jgi:sulfite exporter TauE/SafE
MNDLALSALARAWAATAVAVFLLVAGLTLARAWDGAMYVQGLEEALNLEE